MLHRKSAVGLLPVLSRHPVILAALASLIAHVSFAVGLVLTAGELSAHEPDMVVDLDLEVAPPAPEGFDPQAQTAPSLEQDTPAEPDEPAAGAEAKADEATGTTLEPEPEPVDEEAEKRKAEEAAKREKERKAREQADEEEERREEEEERAAEAARNQSPADAGPVEAQATPGAAMDGGVAGGAVASASQDAGAAGPSPFERAAESLRSATIGTAPTAGDPRPIRLPPGASSDLRAYSPAGDKIAVLVRYDRLRGTPWAALADDIIAPMPDYRSIVGDRKVALADLFQSLLISTRNPTRVWATNMVARTHMAPAEVRRFLDHPLQPVTWQPVRGGALGRREPSEVKLDRDHRVYLMPSPGLVVLTASRHLGVLVEPAASVGHTDLNAARAVETDLPLWLSRARAVENEAGIDSSVIAVVTVGGLRSDEVAIPEMGKVPTPERFSLALEMVKVGFYVRGTLAFGTPQLAEEFEVRVNEGRKRLLASGLSQLMLRNLHAYHALKGLTLRRRGQLVTYATSISNADARAGMRLAAEWARRFFENPPETDPLGPSAAPGGPPGAAPSGAAPSGAAPSGAAPSGAAPSGSAPSGEPARARPAEQKPAGTSSGHAPGESSSGQSASPRPAGNRVQSPAASGALPH
jgi:hypothetical protein